MEGAKLEDLKHTQDAASPGTFFFVPGEEQDGESDVERDSR